MSQPDQNQKQPPPVAPRVYKVVKFVGQPLPGLVNPNPFQGYVQPDGGTDSTQRNTAEDGIESLTLQDQIESVESSPQEEQHHTRRVRFTRQTQHSSFEQPLKPRPNYQRSLSTPLQGFDQHALDEEGNELLDWWQSEEPWKNPGCPDTGKDTKALAQKAENLKRGIYLYDYFLSERSVVLQGHIMQLQQVANEIDKVHKGVKIAGITGGTAGAVGAAAAVGGVILAPFTMGASLAVAAVGVGVAAAGGAAGAGAAITKKVHTTTDKKKVETILKEHKEQIEEIERCVKFIGTSIECLKKYDLSTLKGVDWNTVKIVRMAHNAGDSVGAVGALSKSSGLIEGFAVGLDIYFSKEDDKKLKKGSETKFAKQIRKVAKQMEASLDELMKFQTLVELKDM